MDNKELARMFARYWGCKVTYRNEWGRFKGEVDWQTMQKLTYNTDVSSYKLILKPIEDISDEDARHVAAIPKNSIQSEAERIDYLRSKGYDIDNLIPRGYAVDEKEVKCD